MPGGSAGRYHSPLRYPGGKGKVANYFKILLTENGLLGTDYVEPYAGGASVALGLLYEDYVGHIHINDLNSGVYAFWYAAIHETGDLCARIDRTEVTMEEWHRQRDVYRRAADADPLDLAFAVFFLNRTNRSGIIAGGVIGGQNQTGAWKLDARYNKPELLQRIKKLGRHRDRISLTRSDAAELIDQWATRNDDAFFYLDPPYFVKGEGLYDNFYAPEDHRAVATAVLSLRHPWVVSYDAAPEIIEMYRPARSLRYRLSYSAHERQAGSEVMFYSDDLRIPENLPAGISVHAVDAVRSPAR